MGEWIQLIGVTASALATVIGAVGGAIVAVRRVSPKERGRAVAEAAKPSVDDEQTRLIEELKKQVDELTGGADADAPDEA